MNAALTWIPATQLVVDEPELTGNLATDRARRSEPPIVRRVDVMLRLDLILFMAQALEPTEVTGDLVVPSVAVYYGTTMADAEQVHVVGTIEEVAGKIRWAVTR